MERVQPDPLHTVNGLLVLVAGGFTAGRADRQDIVELSGLLEGERDGHSVALGERLLHLHEHQMQAAALQFHGLARRNDDAVAELAHLHDIVFHRHFMYFDAAGRGAFDRDQSVVGTPGILDGKAATADLCARQHRLRRTARDFEIADLDGTGRG